MRFWMREICASTSIRNPNAKSGNLKSLLRSRANGHLQILLFAVAPRKAWRRPARRSRGMNPQGGQLGHRASAEGAAHRGRTACAPRPRSAANVAVEANAWWAACATGVGSRDGAATDHMDAGKQQRCGAQLRRAVAAVQHQHAQDAAVGVGTAGCPAARSSLPRSIATGAPRSGRVRSVYSGRWLERRHYAGRAPSASAGRDAENQGGHMQSTGQPNRDGARPSARHLARAWPDPLNGMPPSVAATSLPPNLYTYRSALACSDTALVS